MQRRVTSVATAMSAGTHALRAMIFITLALLLLTWSQAAKGSGQSSEAAFTTDAATSAGQAITGKDATTDAEGSAESVTMSIPLDEDGVIDVDAPHMDVKIEKWDGDDVLLIVEKKRTRAKTCGESPSANAVTIQVTRDGRNVRIETAGGSSQTANLPDVSFRIVLPEDDDTAVRLHEQSDTVERLTAVVWRALRREALRWLTR